MPCRHNKKRGFFLLLPPMKHWVMHRRLSVSIDKATSAASVWVSEYMKKEIYNGCLGSQACRAGITKEASSCFYHQ